MGFKMLIKRYIIIILVIFLSNYLIAMDIEKNNQNTKSELLELSDEMLIEIIQHIMISYINNWNVISRFDHEVNVVNLIKDLNNLKLVNKELNNKLSVTEISNLFQKIRYNRFSYLFKKLKEKSTLEQPNINELNSRLNSIINNEVEFDPEEVIQLLIAGADLNLKDQNENTILSKAIAQGSKELIEVIKELGFNVVSDLHDTFKLTPLMKASSYGHKNIVSMLLKLAADIDSKDIYKGTALIYACKRGHTDIVKLLIDHNADVNHIGDTAIYYKIDENYSSYKRSALIYACIYDHLEIVKLLVESKVDINIQDECGNTALMSALKYRRKDIVDFLIEKGADLNIKNFKNETTLMLASYQGYDDIVKLCIQNGIDVNEQELFDKETALILACKAYYNNENYVIIVKMLLEAGADITLKDKFDLCALKIALYRDNIDIINILIKAGAKIEDTEFNDLIYVLENCKYKVAVFLIYNYFKAKFNAYNLHKIVKQIKRV